MPEEGGLAAVEVTVTFGGLVALDRVSMGVAPGEIVGVIGPNGAGKTTLFNVLCGFVRPDSGHIIHDGKQVRVRTNRLRSMGVARTLQGVGLWPGLTVAENVMVGARKSRWAGFGSALLGLPNEGRADKRVREQAEALLSELGMAEQGDRLPGALPYALQKRASLARALMGAPKLLLLDEPASGLSQEEIADLGTYLRQLRSRMGVLLVEHHMDLVMTVCDRIVVLDFGKVIASGSPDEVRSDPVVTTAYLGEDVADLGDHAVRGGWADA
jgi:branched-chain amino acid transport system ATP-binding protein